MTVEELLANGYKAFRYYDDMSPFRTLYQKRVRDERGTRYHINVAHWHPSNPAPLSNTFCLDINFNDGFVWSPTDHASQIKVWGGINSWSVQQLESWCDQLWTRLSPRYEEEIEGDDA